MVRAAREILRPNRHLPGAMAAGAGATMNRSRKPLVALAACVIAAAILIPSLAHTRGGGGRGHAHGSNYCTICARDSQGRIVRSPEARQEFMTQTGYPHGRPGYVVDHVIPLKRGGADEPWNMQWQTIAAGKAKDATE
jgi:hypothetical protein